MAINFFNSEKIIRLTPVNSETKDIADKILAGDVRVFPKLSNVKVESLPELWEMEFDSSPSTYGLYVYALYPVAYLLNAYECTEDALYLDKALKLSLNFIDWELEGDKIINKKRLKILFGDHAVSNRTQALCYLVCSLGSARKEVPSAVTEALLKNGEYLADINNYSHYNHGLMMDLALLGLLNTLEGIELEYPAHLKENLIARLQYSITRDITEDGVHVENSPGYHFWMLSFLRKIAEPLASLDKSLHLQASALFHKAAGYAKYITRPDGTVPAIGDTHARLMYKPFSGLSSQFFKHANQVIFRSRNDDTWAYFSSGYKTHVHKHCDNGALNIFYEGKDVFFDPGFLNYENNIDSNLIKSTIFHNTVRPKNEEQIITNISLSGEGVGYNSNRSSSSILWYQNFNNFEAALSRICDYKSFDVERLVVWIKPNIFAVYDQACEPGEILQQSFHVPSEHIVRSHDESVVILDDVGNVFCKLKQYQINQISKTEAPLPVKISVKKAFFARKFNDKEASSIIVSENASCFFTVIELGCGVENVCDVNISEDLTVNIMSSDGLVSFNLEGIKEDLK